MPLLGESARASVELFTRDRLRAHEASRALELLFCQCMPAARLLEQCFRSCHFRLVRAPVDLEEGVIADELVDAFGTDYWRKLSKKERVELNRRTAGASALPSAPRMYGELTELLSSGESSVGDVARIVEADMAMAGD